MHYSFIQVKMFTGNWVYMNKSKLIIPVQRLLIEHIQRCMQLPTISLNIVADCNHAVYNVENDAAYETIIIIAFPNGNIFRNQILKG